MLSEAGVRFNRRGEPDYAGIARDVKRVWKFAVVSRQSIRSVVLREREKIKAAADKKESVQNALKAIEEPEKHTLQNVVSQTVGMLVGSSGDCPLAPGIEICVGALLHGQQLQASRLIETVSDQKSVSHYRARRIVDGYLADESILHADPCAMFAETILKTMRFEGRFVVALDWTEFDAGRQRTLCAGLILQGKQTVLLAWRTVDRGCETKLVTYEKVLRSLQSRLDAVDPTLSSRCIVLGDAEFGTVPFVRLLESLGFLYCVRTRNNTHVRDKHGNSKTAAQRWKEHGLCKEPIFVQEAEWTKARCKIPAVVIYKADGMKRLWTLLSNIPDQTAAQLLALYLLRWGIETHFRNVTSVREGLGLKRTIKSQPLARDRQWLCGELASVMVTCLGAAMFRAQRCRRTVAVCKRKTPRKSWHRLGRDVCGRILVLPQEARWVVLNDWSLALRQMRDLLRLEWT